MRTLNALITSEGELLQLGVRARAQLDGRPASAYAGFSALVAECLPADQRHLELVAHAIELPAVTLADLADGGNVAHELVPGSMVALARAMGLDRATFLALVERDAVRQVNEDQAAGLTPYDEAFVAESLRDLGAAWDLAAYQEGLTPNDA